MPDGEGGDPDVIERDHSSLGLKAGIHLRVADGRGFINPKAQAPAPQVADPQAFFFWIIALAQSTVEFAQNGYGHPYFFRLIEAGRSNFVPTEQADHGACVDGDATSLDDPIRCLHCFR